MKTFSSIKTFFCSVILLGLALWGVLRVLVGASNPIDLWAHFTVLLVLVVVPASLVVTRIQAVRCGLTFFPKMKAKARSPRTLAKKTQDRKRNVLYFHDPLISMRSFGFSMGWDIFDTSGKPRKRTKK